MNENVLSIEESLAKHLTDHAVSIPVSMVGACKQAIDAINRGEPDTIVELPEGVSFFSIERNQSEKTVEAFKLIILCHLDPFINKTYQQWRELSKVLNP